MIKDFLNNKKMVSLVFCFVILNWTFVSGLDEDNMMEQKQRRIYPQSC